MHVGEAAEAEAALPVHAQSSQASTMLLAHTTCMARAVPALQCVSSRYMYFINFYFNLILLK